MSTQHIPNKNNNKNKEATFTLYNNIIVAVAAKLLAVIVLFPSFQLRRIRIIVCTLSKSHSVKFCLRAVEKDRHIQLAEGGRGEE